MILLLKLFPEEAIVARLNKSVPNYLKLINTFVSLQFAEM
jgi:hypothetical protein